MFHLENARKAGYKDEDIVKHLASKLGFNHEKAMKAGHSAMAIAEYLSTHKGVKNNDKENITRVSGKEQKRESIIQAESIPSSSEKEISASRDIQAQKEVTAYADVNGHWTKIPMKYQEALDANQTIMDILKKPFDEIMGLLPAQLKKDMKEDFKTFREQGLTKRKAQKKVIEDLRERFEEERKEIEGRKEIIDLVKAKKLPPSNEGLLIETIYSLVADMAKKDNGKEILEAIKNQPKPVIKIENIKEILEAIENQPKSEIKIENIKEILEAIKNQPKPIIKMDNGKEILEAIKNQPRPEIKIENVIEKEERKKEKWEFKVIKNDYGYDITAMEK